MGLGFLWDSSAFGVWKVTRGSLFTSTAATSIGKTVTTNFVTEDITYDLVAVEIWSILEDQVGIIVASTPALRQLFIWSRQSISARRTKTYTQDRTFDRTTISEPSAVQGKSGISKENLIPLGTLPVRKTTELEVNFSNKTESDDLERGIGWD
ncbi:hypothetical protein HO173_003885 [Letharia columbiana]|uniref:Rhodopsin domain-containing protein n=1 Tax=Letharia columbiana TaxID=112416 RepID=A0A8H6L6V9_9LECA|nr:uncharacterized protein HO173_003885 [Letharia columbiana]KAF6237684.1 hypothetical protein HO173_003885 [Letharia columbiana]